MNGAHPRVATTGGAAVLCALQSSGGAGKGGWEQRQRQRRGRARTTNTAPIGRRPLLTREAVPRSRAYLMAATGLRPAERIRDTPGQRLRFLMRQVRE